MERIVNGEGSAKTSELAWKSVYRVVMITRKFIVVVRTHALDVWPHTKKTQETKSTTIKDLNIKNLVKFLGVVIDAKLNTSQTSKKSVNNSS